MNENGEENTIEEEFLNIKVSFFKAMADPTRLRILEKLVTEKELNVSQLCEAIGKDQSSISHHLACLRNCGLVRTKKNGKFIVYMLNDYENIADFLAIADQHARELLPCRRL